MTDLTAEWCREQAGMFKEDFEWPKTEAALLLAARVLDEQTVEELAKILWYTHHESPSQEDLIAYARAVLAYLKGDQ